MSYDIIGDVHGYNDRLVALLRTLGYRETLRGWRHPGRTGVFVGDFIDRSPQQLATLRLVLTMTDTGAALAVLGNHELNAIAWETPDPPRPGRWLRAHDRPGNRWQRAAFLAEVEGSSLHREAIDWFKTLPLWLDLGAIRVVHACWDDQQMDLLRPQLGPGTTLTDELLVRASRPGDPAFDALEGVCKGPEAPLRHGLSFTDKYGTRRTKARVRWWERDPCAGPPAFFGHYCLTDRPQPLAPNLARVDYSVAEGGELVAYRWEGEPALRATPFVWV